MAEKQEKILDIKVNYNSAIKAIAEYQTKIDEAREAEVKLKKQLKDGEISRQQYNEEIAASKAYIADCNDSIRIITKTMQNQLKQEKAQENSLVSLRAQLSNLTAEYDALSEAERKGAKGTELKDKINEITDAIKGCEEETQRYYRNVGNYEEAIKNAVASNIPFIGTLMQTQEEMGGLKNATVTAMAAVKNFSKSLLALLANPIVAILAAIAVVVMAVAKGIKSSEENTNRWNAVMAPLSMALDAVGKVLQVVASGILSVVEAGGKMMGWINKQLEKLPVLGKYIAVVNKENERYIAMAKEQAAIDRDTRNLQVQNAKNALTIATLKAKADDELNVSAKERMEAIREANRLEEEASKKNYELAKRRYELMVQQNAMADNTKETNDAIAQAEVEMYNALTEYQDKRGELLGREVSLANEIKSAEKERADAAKEAKQVELEAVRAAEDAMLALVRDKREQARKEIEQNYSRQIEDLQIRLKQEENLTVKAREAINSQIVALEQQKVLELQRLSDEELQKEIEDRTKLISLQLEAVKEGSEQEYQLKLQQLATRRDAELSDKELTEQMKLAIVGKYNKQIDDLALQHEQNIATKQQEAIRLRMENELMQLQQSGASELEILQAQAEQKLELMNSIQQQEEESEEAYLNRKLQAQQEYLDAKRNISEKEIEIEQTKADAISQITGAMASLLEQAGENNRSAAIAAKTLAIAEVAISQGVAIANAVKAATAGSKSIWEVIASIATAITTVVSTMATATKSIKSAKFATGGLVTGPGTGTSDSVPAQLSNGESVITARATEMFAPILSSFNMMGGGVPINVAQSSSQSIGEDMLARAVAKGMLMAPAPQVSVEEFTSVANKVKFLESNGSL